MERAVVEEYDWEILVEEDAENAATREDTLLGLLYVKDFPDKKAEQDIILLMATPLKMQKKEPIPGDVSELGRTNDAAESTDRTKSRVDRDPTQPGRIVGTEYFEDGHPFRIFLRTAFLLVLRYPMLLPG